MVLRSIAGSTEKQTTEGGFQVGIKNGDWLRLANVEFTNSTAKKFSARHANAETKTADKSILHRRF